MKLSKNIIPVGDKIAVVPLKNDTVTKGGLVIPDAVNKKQKPKMGTIIAVSEYLRTVFAQPDIDPPLPTGFVSLEHKLDPLAVGDVVLFAEYAGDDVLVKDLETNEDVLIKLLPCESVLGLVEDPLDADAKE